MRTSHAMPGPCMLHRRSMWLDTKHALALGGPLAKLMTIILISVLRDHYTKLVWLVKCWIMLEYSRSGLCWSQFLVEGWWDNFLRGAHSCAPPTPPHPYHICQLNVCLDKCWGTVFSMFGILDANGRLDLSWLITTCDCRHTELDQPLHT